MAVFHLTISVEGERKGGEGGSTAFGECFHLLTYELALSDRDCDTVKRNHLKAGPVQVEKARED